ncbi:MAG: FG-GAP repeat domain-containing protein [Planctomycetota bacterium]|jgi:hypothetical protein
MLVNGKPLEGSRRVVKQGPDGKRKVETIPGSHPKAEQYTKIHLADWDRDGRRDLLVGHSTGEFLLYRNEGEKGKPVFTEPSVIRPEDDTFPLRPSPHLFDWDRDGKRDLLVGADSGRVYFYRNVGKDDAPHFKKGVLLTVGGGPLTVGKRTRLHVTDWNNDGVSDLLVGDFLVEKAKDAPRGRAMTGHVWLFLGKGDEGF